MLFLRRTAPLLSFLLYLFLSVGPTVATSSDPSPPPLGARRKGSTFGTNRTISGRKIAKKDNKQNNQQQQQEKNSYPANGLNTTNMGQVMRVARYDRAANERNALSALQIMGAPLNWFRLDDGVMGGQSETQHCVVGEEKDDSGGILHFRGTINANGGGFASIRSKIPETVSLANCQGIKLRVRGDGKTYKFLLSDGTGAGPFSRNPSWQFDIPTENLVDKQSADADNTTAAWRDVTIPFDQLLPSFAGGPRAQPTDDEQQRYTFDASSMREMGLMLSLKRSDGSPNPKETFGEGIFPFALAVQSVVLY